MDGTGDASLVGSWENPALDTTTYAVSANGTEITNQLSDADLNLYEGSDQEITYVSRNDWEGTWPSETVKIALTEQLIDDLQLVQYDPADYEEMEMPTLGAAQELTLYDMIGLDYDDPQWDALLDQLTFLQIRNRLLNSIQSYVHHMVHGECYFPVRTELQHLQINSCYQ